jgi:hypothetical protein
VIGMSIWLIMYSGVVLLIRNYKYPQHRLSLDFIDRLNPVQIHQKENIVQRRVRQLASQEERQVSLRSYTLDGGFVL